MRIGITGPVSLGPLISLLKNSDELPPTYSFPLIGILARELHDRGHDVVVFAGSKNITSPVRFSGERITVSITPRRILRTAYDFNRVERRFLVESMRSECCDIIHAHWTYEFASAALESRTPTIVTAHDAPLSVVRYFIHTKAAFHYLFRAALAFRILHNARHISAVSPYVANHIRRALYVKTPVEVIPNGVNGALFELGRNRLASGSEESQPLFATVLEGFSERKNAKRALEAFALLRKSIPDAHMNMYGVDFGPEEEASLWAKKNRISDGVSFIGKVAQKQLFEDLTERATVLFHPALEEAHPMAICEAMALGLPVVGGSFSGGVPFTLDGGRAGVLVDVCNPTNMARALGELAGDPSRRRHLAEAAWRFAKKHFTLDTMVESYLERYQSILTSLGK
jgi:glycosyltransferase involved in cell wall biosynthesis